MRLVHLKLPGVSTYGHVGRIQESLIQRHFLSRDLWRATKASEADNAHSAPLPDPTIITAEFQPVYTFGRRQLHSVSDEQRHILEDNGTATVVEAQRGGQVTFHGPGQLVVYPVIDLRRHKIMPRDYVRLLEETVMSVCTVFGVPNVETTTDPGVWIRGGERKICAVGVHIRRGITGHGIGLNIHDRDQFLSWGFGRIVACGLEGKQATWLSKERADKSPSVHVESVASAFVKHLAERLGGVSQISEATEQSYKTNSEQLNIG